MDHHNYPLGDPRHPLWELLKLALCLAFLTGALALTAQHFDSTELRAIVLAAVPAIATFIGHRLLKNRANKKDQE